MYILRFYDVSKLNHAAEKKKKTSIKRYYTTKQYPLLLALFSIHLCKKKNQANENVRIALFCTKLLLNGLRARQKELRYIVIIMHTARRRTR